MRIVIAHNYYGSSSPSGENEVVTAEAELLRSHGHEVMMFERHSDSIRDRGITGATTGALSVPWNPFSARKMREVVASWKPDILHAHNTFPLISPAIFPAAAGGPARVLTLHNYRLLCAAGIPMRDNRPCTLCIEKRSVAPALHYGCYRDSRIATVPLAAGIALHRARGTWHKDVEALIALTDFQRDLLSRGGLPAAMIEVKPNFYPGRPHVRRWDERPPHCVFVGRLSPEKGVLKLIRAWRKWGGDAPSLLVIGDGPLRSELEREAAGARVSFLGQLPRIQTERHIAEARLLILPSECFEGFPMVVREAFAFGTPVAVSDLGALPSIVGGGRLGFLLDPFDDTAVTDRLRRIWADSSRLRQIGEAGNREFLLRYTADANIKILHRIYDRALERRKQA
ncbi:glycosyltransferase family 4 protein [Sphingomonas sp. MG17]|uniref:Glycosyltransferase family 4 protein n=1 Tax=Sphingomonas tagetis TaxID=2949092 RepID=A0A9X2HP64_9SPHN|nr:glycosyltransferase family 4 protein [Sphingomonas tagetis]MCP3732899.1 glycosyltransferase family 4 protein [Sphingomonas tagetis]